MRIQFYLIGISTCTCESRAQKSCRFQLTFRPEGAIGKDGPSAGTALVVALVSLLTKTKVDWDIAMTGEISLLGQVLRVGGLKEKTLAAHRTGIKSESGSFTTKCELMVELVVPLGCRAEIEENVPDSVKEGIEFVYVDSVRQVLHEVFKGEEVAERWKETLPIDKEPERVLPGQTTSN